MKKKEYIAILCLLAATLSGCTQKPEEKAFEIIKYEDRVTEEITFDDLVLEMMEANPEDRDFTVELEEDDWFLPQDALWLKEFELKVLRKEPITKEEYLEYFDRYAFYYDTLDTEDSDGDGLPNWLEEKYHTNPLARDTDGDGLLDGYEVFSSMTDPLKKDTDDNGIEDGDEDYDNDGLTNIEEQFFGSEAFIYDTDNDGLSDYEEAVYKTDPTMQDTDGDGIYDGIEVYITDTNPLKVASGKDEISDGEKLYDINYICHYKDGNWNSTLLKQYAVEKINEPQEPGQFIAIVHINLLGRDISNIGIGVKSMERTSFTEGAISPFFMVSSKNKEKIELSIEFLYKETNVPAGIYFADLEKERSWPVQTVSDKKGHFQTEIFEMNLNQYFYLKDVSVEIDKWNNW